MGWRTNQVERRKNNRRIAVMGFLLFQKSQEIERRRGTNRSSHASGVDLHSAVVGLLCFGRRLVSPAEAGRRSQAKAKLAFSVGSKAGSLVQDHKNEVKEG
jgi:hypothetical protein